MSSITAAASALLTSPSFHGHGHRRGAQPTAGSSSSTSGASSGNSNSIGQLPVGVSTALFNGLVQSFQQAMGSQATPTVSGVASTAATQGSAPQAAASGPSGPGAATPGQGQELQAFQHSLLQALKQDGATSSGTGNIVSSLQSLIQQVGPNGKPTAATETLTSTFQNLVNGVNGAAAASASSSAGSTSNQSPTRDCKVSSTVFCRKCRPAARNRSLATGSNVNTHV